MLRPAWLASVLALGCFAGNLSAADFGPESAWIRDDLNKALEEGKKTGKPIFVVFRCER